MARLDIRRGASIWFSVVFALLGSSVASGESADSLGTSDPVCDAARMTASVTLTDAIIEALRSEPHVIVARQDLIEAKADATAAVAPFLPKAQLIIDEERFLPANGFSPVTVVGTNVLGGTRSYSAYGAITLSWSIVSSGRDVAGLHAARADVHASTEALHGQFADTLSALLKAYSDVYETQVSLAQQGQSLILLKAIAQRADERYQHGNGTTIAIGQARGAALDAEKSFNEACRSLTEKSSALAKAMGIRLPGGRIFEVVTKLPEAPAHPLEASDFDVAIGADPAVLAAREKVVAAEEKARQTRSAFGPQISLDARRDYLGQNIDSFSAANNSLASNSYRVDISLVQPIFPFLAEIGALDKAKAEVRRAEALAEEARNEVDSKLRTAVSADSEARSSYRAANSSLREAEQVLVLTESLYKAGRTDLDEIERAKIDLQKITAEVEMLASTKSRAAWDVERALSAARFPTTLMHQVGIELADEYLGYGR